jgi:hypothetical protein
MNATLLRQIIADNPGKTDAEVAALYPDAAKSPRVDKVTYTTLGSLWGVARAAAVRARLRAILADPSQLAPGNPAAAAALAEIVDYVHGVLEGTGLDPQYGETAAYLGQFATLGVITADEADAVRWVIPDAPSVKTVAAERAAKTADALIAASRAAEQAAVDAATQPIADRHAAYVTAVEAWRDAGGAGTPPDLATFRAGEGT